MINKIFIVGMLTSSLTFVYANAVLVQSVQQSKVDLSLEWMGLILLSVIGFIFIYRSARQIQKIKILQKELDTYHTTVTNELDTLGGKDA